MKSVWKTWGGVLLLLPLVAAVAADGDDYGRSHIGGSRGPIEWESLLAGDGLAGWQAVDSAASAWSREDDTIVVDAGGQESSRLATGDSSWAQYELKVQVTPGMRVSSLEIHFGCVSGGDALYSLNYLAGWKAMAISRFEKGVGATKLDVVNTVLEGGQEYDIVLAVRGRSVTSYIDGVLVNRLTLPAPPRGGIELATWGRSTTARFRDPKIRHY